jgi:uncharacterized tellurite resistance protein B-like protein
MKRDDALHRPSQVHPIDEDAPEAAARVLVLAIVADGRLGACEVQALDDADAYARLGLDRDGFYRVMRAVCADLMAVQGATGDSMFRLDASVAHQWLDLVRAPRLRQTVLELAFEVIRSDGVLHPGESRLFWQALDLWGLRLDDLRTSRRTAAAAGPLVGERRVQDLDPVPHRQRRARLQVLDATDIRRDDRLCLQRLERRELAVAQGMGELGLQD